MFQYESTVNKIWDSIFRNPVPSPARLYILLILPVGLPIFLGSLYWSFLVSDKRWLFLAASTVIVSCFPLRIPLRKGTSIAITVSDVFNFAALLLFGPAVMVTIAVLEGITTSLRTKVKPYKLYFNVAQLAISAFLVGLVLYAIERKPVPLDPGYPRDFTRFLIECAFCGVIYFILSSGLLVIAMSLTTKQPVVDIWVQNLLSTSITHVVGASLGAVIFLYFQRYEFYSVILTLPITLLMYYAYKVNQDRIQQALQHLSEVNALLTQKIEAEKALQRSKEELEIRVLERTAELRNANEQLRFEINERIEAEIELAAEKERLAVTLRSIGDGVIATDTRGIVLLINNIAETLIGRSQIEAAGRPLAEVFNIINSHNRQRCENPVERVLRTGQIIGFDAKDTSIISWDGSERSIDNTAAPIRDKAGNILGVVLVFRDMTDQQRMERELIKTQKLESLGILAGGIAHDFNNILAGILLKTQLAQRAVEKSKDPAKFLTSIEEATQMATALTHQLLTFARGGAPIKKIASIKNLLRDSSVFALRGSNVRCDFQISDDLLAVEIDEGQINQVMNNLVLNAQQAMPDGGTITVRAQNVKVGANHPADDLTEGEYVMVSVQDHGVGISPLDLPRIFDPYFTTKPKGTGLGLASTYSIIQRHHGHLTVDSKIGAGSTFIFYLPASHSPVQERPLEQEKLLAGKGKVLVMDDEEMIRDSMKELLNGLGYAVDAAADGTEAISLYQEALTSGSPFDAVIMDLTIAGGMGGKETIRKLLEIDPKVTAIVTSGYSKDPVMANYREHGFRAVLVKPFKLEDVGRIIAETLKPGEFPSANSAQQGVA
ncbi:MAG TPA: ATP-binding protein [Acidobacteriota bacterium]